MYKRACVSLNIVPAYSIPGAKEVTTFVMLPADVLNKKMQGLNK